MRVEDPDSIGTVEKWLRPPLKVRGFAIAQLALNQNLLFLEGHYFGFFRSALGSIGKKVPPVKSQSLSFRSGPLAVMNNFQVAVITTENFAWG